MNRIRRTGLGVLLASTLAVPAFADELVFAVADSYSMPLARQNKKTVQEGILKDLGEAVAAKLGATAVFKVVPRDRLSEMLQSGEVDLVCNSRPEWMPLDGGKWSQPFLPVGDVLVFRPGTEAPGKLQDLAGKKIGTIKGYRYPEVEQALGDKFVRADAADIAANLNKVRMSAIDFAIVDELVFNYQRKVVPDNGLAPRAYRLTDLKTQCALSAKSKFAAPKVFAATDEVAKSGLKAILDKYR